MPQRAKSARTASPSSGGERLDPEAPAGPQPVALDHDDRLILWMLGLPPLRRLEVLQDFVDGLTALRHARKISR